MSDGHLPHDNDNDNDNQRTTRRRLILVAVIVVVAIVGLDHFLAQPTATSPATPAANEAPGPR